MPQTLSRSSWQEVSEGLLVLVPLGSLEQHGPHLPLGVDSAIADAVAQRVAQRLEDHGVPTVRAPTLLYGASGEHQDFPGTVSIGSDALAHVLTELGRSVCHWARGVVFLSGHGGNATGVKRAVSVLRAEHRFACWTSCIVGEADAHAGHTETSVMLALEPASVRLAKALAGNTESLTSLMPRLRREGVRAVSPSGVLGDPTHSKADEGAAILEAMSAQAFQSIRESIDHEREAQA